MEGIMFTLSKNWRIFKMINATLSSGLTGQANAAVTNNAYSAYSLASNLYGIIAVVAITLLLVVVICMPKKLQTLLVGYATMFFIGCGLFAFYVAYKSAGPVSKALWVEWLIPLGKLLVDWGLYIVVSIPLAYYVGKKIEPLFGENNET
jgi:hypothetical protein